MNDWSAFPKISEARQARFLLDIAMAAWQVQQEPADIRCEVRAYLKLGYEVLEGSHDSLPQLIRFLEDPNMRHDFGAFYEHIKTNDKASAALDLASYACGFVCRVAAKTSDYGPLPDPVLESLPEIYEYYQERAEVLGL